MKAFIITYFPIFSAFVAWFAAQFAKLLLTLVLIRKLDFKKLFSSGGMPSSHTASVCALSTSLFLLYGPASPYFAISAMFSFIVMYDATGVRRSTGEQAQVLNQIIIDLMEQNSTVIDKNLKEILGHTPFEVFIGAIVGISIPCLLNLLIPVV